MKQTLTAKGKDIRFSLINKSEFMYYPNIKEYIFILRYPEYILNEPCARP